MDAYVYGLARMAIYGHFARWGVDSRQAEAVAEAMPDFFVDRIAPSPVRRGNG